MLTLVSCDGVLYEAGEEPELIAQRQEVREGQDAGSLVVGHRVEPVAHDPVDPDAETVSVVLRNGRGGAIDLVSGTLRTTVLDY
jgi:hypothetical protein